MMKTNPIIRVYFKVARTTNHATYDVDVNWTTEQFIYIMREKVTEDFNLENAEFVHTSQNLPPGLAAEDGAAVESSNITLIEKYGNQIYQNAFYIRPLPPMAINVTPDEEHHETTYLFPDRSCSICMTQERNLVFMPCNHLCACAECGFNPTINTCPMCRSAFTSRMVVYV